MAILAVVALLVMNKVLPPDRPIQLNVKEECDVAMRDCQAADGDVALTVSLSPRPVPVLDAVSVTVNGHGFSGDTLQLRITGVEQDMGLIETTLRRGLDDRYHGHFYLSVCSRTLMTWRMVISTPGEAPGMSATFHFQTRAQRPVEILGR